MNLDDTIVAISSAVGAAGRMIVRVSGDRAFEVRGKLSADERGEHATARRQSIGFSGLKFPGWVYSFVGPRSYTGQDLIEVHIPGNPLLARMLVEAIAGMGARLAEPGEFTARAYFGGRMDLSQAEGVAAAIAATSGQHLAAAQRLLGGELSRRVRPVMEIIAQTLALVEVGIDFSQEDVSFLSAAQVKARIGEASRMLEDLVGNSARFEKVSHEPRVVLAGRPNAGKSTLLNALAGRARAVVSPVAGTTRDVLSAEITLRRGMIRMSDVAGVDEATGRGAIEDQMRARALHEIQTADVVILVRDVTDERPPVMLGREANLIVLTKADLGAGKYPDQIVCLSAVTGINLELLRDRLDAIAFGSEAGAEALALNARHIRAIGEARAALVDAMRSVEGNAAELVASDLRQCLDGLGNILGAVSPDDILGRIFSTFCIGK